MGPTVLLAYCHPVRQIAVPPNGRMLIYYDTPKVSYEQTGAEGVPISVEG